jgi:hypothetical protein
MAFTGYCTWVPQYIIIGWWVQLRTRIRKGFWWYKHGEIKRVGVGKSRHYKLQGGRYARGWVASKDYITIQTPKHLLTSL